MFYLPYPIPSKSMGVLFGVDPWCRSLQSVNTLAANQPWNNSNLWPRYLNIMDRQLTTLCTASCSEFYEILGQQSSGWWESRSQFDLNCYLFLLRDLIWPLQIQFAPMRFKISFNLWLGDLLRRWKIWSQIALLQHGWLVLTWIVF